MELTSIKLNNNKCFSPNISPIFHWLDKQIISLQTQGQAGIAVLWESVKGIGKILSKFSHNHVPQTHFFLLSII